MKRTLTLLTTLALTVAMIAPGVVSAAESAALTYVVQRGDTWYSLAARYGVSLTRLMASNNTQAAFGLTPGASKLLWLYPGQAITIPVSLGTTPSLVNPFHYTVQPGETLTQIAFRFEQSLWHIRQANGIAEDVNLVSPGVTLLMPAGPHYHRLTGGETLADVAAMYGVTVDYLLRFNQNGTAPGMDIFIPVQYDRPFTPMGRQESNAASQQESNSANEQESNSASQQGGSGVAEQGGPLVFRWFGVNSATPDPSGVVKIVLVAEFKGGQPPYTLTIGGKTIATRGPFVKTDNGQQWSNLEFDWQTFCNQSFPLPGTLTSADGQSAFMSNGIGPFSCE